MFTARGQIRVNKEVLFQDVIFHIDQVHSNEQQLGYWSGNFTVPSGAAEGFVKLYEAHEPLTIVLEDGRTGNFNWTDIDGVGAGATVSFQGTGALK